MIFTDRLHPEKPAFTIAIFVLFIAAEVDCWWSETSHCCYLNSLLLRASEAHFGAYYSSFLFGPANAAETVPVRHREHAH